METEQKKKSKLGERFARQLGAYSAAAGAFLAISPQAHSAVHVTQPVTPLIISKNSPAVSIDMDGDGVMDFSFTKQSDRVSTTFYYLTFLANQRIDIIRNNPANRFQLYACPIGSLRCGIFASKLPAGVTVAANGDKKSANLMYTFTSGMFPVQNWPSYGQFNAGGDGYIGVKFRGHKGIDYQGWIHFIGGTDISDVSGTIESWAYEDSGGAIKAGDDVGQFGDAPVADAGPDQRFFPGTRVTLRGDNSTDADGDQLAFRWTQESGPVVKLSGASKAIATFIAPQVGRNGQSLVFNLEVTDPTQQSSMSRCIVNVSSHNIPPLANAGADKNVREGKRVMLDGRGSRDAQGGKVSYYWKQNGYPRVELSNPQAARPILTAPKTGNSLTFRLTVKDSGGLLSDDFTIVNVVDPTNKPPVAKAGSDQMRRAGAKVRLDGSKSTDADGGIVSYRWSQISGPPVKLSHPGAAKPTFYAPKVGPSGGDLIFRLIVTDQHGLRSQDRCTVHVKQAK